MLAESEKRKNGSVPPFSEMADAAIFKINEMLPFSHFPTDFDEI
jgi:hypothetical protein